jgi:hypothetical protein
MLRTLANLLTLLLAATLLAGCMGEFGMEDTGGADGPTFVGAGGDNGGGTATSAEPAGPAFTLPRDNIGLLPFGVRMNKLVGVTGIALDDPVYAELFANRYELGDHDFANGIQPDLTWNSAKMSLWVRGLKDVCAAPAFREKYPFLPEHLNELFVASYGREAAVDELAIFEDVLADTTLDDDAKYRAVCMGVLGSTEFVAR